MKNILMVASDNNLDSGAFRSMVHLCELLNASREYKIIVVLPKKGNGVSLLKEKNIEYVVIRSYSWVVNIKEKDKAYVKVLMAIKQLLNYIAVFRICHIISSRRIDIIHINTIWSYVGAKAALCSKKKLVWHIRESVELHQNKCLYKEKYYSLINRADRIICISDFIKDYYSGKIDPKKMCVVYNGINSNYYYINDRGILSGDTVKILNIGNMNSNKGQENVITAAKKLLDDGIYKFHVSFVGTGRNESKLKEMCRDLGLEKNITFFGVQKDIIEFYRKNDVLIVSGNYEAFGRTTIEGMMAGCFVIGSNTGATPNLLDNGKYGFLYNPSDDMDLYRKMKLLFNSDVFEIREIAKIGQKYAVSNYSAEINANGVSKIYELLQ